MLMEMHLLLVHGTASTETQTEKESADQFASGSVSFVVDRSIMCQRSILCSEAHSFKLVLEDLWSVLFAFHKGIFQRSLCKC